MWQNAGRPEGRRQGGWVQRDLAVRAGSVAIARAGDVATAHASGTPPGVGRSCRRWHTRPSHVVGGETSTKPLPRVPSVLARLVKRAPMSVTAEGPDGVLALGRAHGPTTAPISKSSFQNRPSKARRAMREQAMLVNALWMSMRRS